MNVATRFAPSPTGRLHVGNARIAIVNWLFARRHAGAMLLRFDDTDRERSRPAFAAAVREDLRWLGLDWQAEYRQSEREDLYQLYFARLLAAGRVYACYETPEELQAMRAEAEARGLPPRYDRRGLRLAPETRAAMERAGRQPYWRFRLADCVLRFVDLVFGEREVDLRSLSDPVIRRTDGTHTYLFASVVDDVELGITHVIRGEDHLTNTAIQLQLFAAFGAEPPRFAHLPLLVDIDGRPLSKRLNDLTLAQLRAEGILPQALFVWLARLGTGLAPSPEDRPNTLVDRFDLRAFSTSPVRFDLAELRHFNRRVLRTLAYDEVSVQLAAMGLSAVDEPFWELVRPNVETVAEVAEWWRIVNGPITPVIEDAALLQQAAELLPEQLTSPEAAREWLQQLSRITGRRGRALYRPLRLALTGREHGPELALLLPRLGRERAAARLWGKVA